MARTTTVRGKHVVYTDVISKIVMDDIRELHGAPVRVYGDPSAYGVIVYRTDGRYLIEYAARGLNAHKGADAVDTLVHFHAFYDQCASIVAFGPGTHPFILPARRFTPTAGRPLWCAVCGAHSDDHAGTACLPA